MLAEYPCPVCSSERWEPVASHVYRREEAPPGDVAALRRRILHELWAGGADTVALTTRLCVRCGFVAYAPRPTADELDAKYRFLVEHEGESGAMRDDPAVRRGEERRARRTYAAVAARLGRAPRTVLDFGGGDGKLMGPFLAAGARCHVVDHHARPRPGVERLGATIADVPGDAAFDTIVASHVLEHVAEPRSVLRELAARLTPDGVVYVEVPDEVWRGVPMRDPVTHVSFFTAGSLSVLLAESGLRAGAVDRVYGSYGARRKRVLVAVARRGGAPGASDHGGGAEATRALLRPTPAATVGRALGRLLG